MSLDKNPKIPEGINYSQENPLKEFFLLVTGIGLSVALIIAALSYSAQFLSPYIPFSWEVSAASFFTQAEPEEKAKENDDALFQQAQHAIQTLGDKLAKQAELDEEFKLSFHLVDSDTPNAFATLGGHVFVTSALIETVSSENALAMVMAHEIAHVKYRHPIQALSRGAIVQLVIIALSGHSGGAVVQNFLGSAGLLTLLRFNRAMESESDQEALIILRRTYGHITGADEFFQHMLEKHEQPEWAEAFLTHPNVEGRIDVIQSAMLQQPAELKPMDVRLTTWITKKKKLDESQQD